MDDQQKQSIDGFTVRRRVPQDTTPKSGVERPAIPPQYMKGQYGRSSFQPVARPQITPPSPNQHTTYEQQSLQPSVGAAARPQLGVQGLAMKQATPVAASPPQQQAVSRSDIDASLAAVDESPRKKQKRSKSPYRKHSAFKRFALIVVALAVLAGGYFVVKSVLASGRMFSGNVFDFLGGGTALKKDANGFTHTLVFGTSEDNEGHAGASLTDSIMVVSVNQESKKVFMTSMPRDMWVDYGQPCLSGYSGKINVIYSCGAENDDVARGASLLRDKVGEVFGLDVQYYVKVNYTVVRELTSALGGVTVTIESSDSRGIYDSNMGSLLRLPNGPATLQGEQALAFVRARGDGYGSYGFEGNNFSREKNQQKLIVAILNKSLSAGTLANPIALNGIIDALGNNIRTNFSAGEVKTLTQLAQNISSDNIESISLVSTSNPVVTTGMYSGQSIVRPIAGIDEYGAIQRYIKKKMIPSSSTSEDVAIQILNGSSRSGVAKSKSDDLKTAGFENITIGDTAYVAPKPLQWYDTSGGRNPKTQAKLASQLGMQPAGSVLPDGVESDADFVIIIGDR